MDGRKVPIHLENPIDDLIIKEFCEPVSNILRSISPKITPNMITSVGMVIGLCTIYALYKKQYILAFFLFWLCYIFDCLDGYYARKYNMVTRFGDYFDHFRDVFVCGTVIYLLYKDMDNIVRRDVYVITLIVSLILMLTHFGSQELNSVSPEHNECLGMLTPLCKHKEYIDYTKYFGCGTFMLVLSMFILSRQISQNRV
jgi:phosphatidylglycerophosphate synthase